MAEEDTRILASHFQPLYAIPNVGDAIPNVGDAIPNVGASQAGDAMSNYALRPIQHLIQQNTSTRFQHQVVNSDLVA